MNNNIFSGLLISGGVIGGLSLFYIFYFWLKRFIRHRFLANVRVFLKYLHRPAVFLAIAFGILAVKPYLRVPDEARHFLRYSIKLWIIGGFGWLAANTVSSVRQAVLSRYDLKAADNLLARRAYTQINIIENMAIAATIFFTLVSMLLIFPDIQKIGYSLLASAGVLGIILGFAAQKTLGNFIAGLQLAFAQPIRIDDVVIVENEWGRIEEITLTYVTVKTWDERRLIVPISYFMEKTFQNWTLNTSELLSTVTLHADYTIPVDKVREELARILHATALWDKKVSVLQVTDATEQTVELRALMSAKDSGTSWDLRCEVREKLLEFIRKNYPQCLPRRRIEINGQASLQPGMRLPDGTQDRTFLWN